MTLASPSRYFVPHYPIFVSHRRHSRCFLRAALHADSVASSTSPRATPPPRPIRSPFLPRSRTSPTLLQLSSSSSTSQILQIRMRPKLCLAISSARGICSHDSPGRAQPTRTRSPSPIRSRTDPAPAVEFLRVFPPWGEDEQFQRALPADGNDVLEINIFGCLSRGECLICAPTEAER